DSAKAAAVASARATHPSLAEAAHSVEPSLEVKQTIVLYPRDEAAWGIFQAMFTAQSAGFWFGPEKLPSSWRLLHLVRKTTLQQTCEELPEGQRMKTEGSGGEPERDQRFNQRTHSRATGAGAARSHPAVARRRADWLPWRPPPPTDAGASSPRLPLAQLPPHLRRPALARLDARAVFQPQHQHPVLGAVALDRAHVD